ncbi:hypothetical protein NUU44_25775, partial [Escherichia coli]
MTNIENTRISKKIRSGNCLLYTLKKKKNYFLYPSLAYHPIGDHSTHIKPLPNFFISFFLSNPLSHTPSSSPLL